LSARVLPDAQHVELAVRDTGIGLTQEQIGRLFKEFSQGEATTSRRYGGTGLGLALSRKLAQALGGDVTVTSRPDEGSTFTLTLPRQSTSTPWRTPSLESYPVASAPTTTVPTPATVLVIDDDAASRDLLSRIFERNGYRVVLAASGPSGLDLARTVRPDAITLDVVMPGMDGWTVLSTLKADPALTAIPVVVITVLDEIPAGTAIGASNVMSKPVDPHQLLSVISGHVRSKGRPLVSAGHIPESAKPDGEDSSDRRLRNEPRHAHPSPGPAWT
jgi:CheY-like chemotaxis protein